MSASSEIKPNASIYTTDGYPRKGLSLHITLHDPSWTCAMYMPGYGPKDGGRGLIESGGGRNYGSLDVFIKGFVAGEDMCLLNKEMFNAERVYAGALRVDENIIYSPDIRVNVHSSTESQLVEIYSIVTDTTLLLPKEDIQRLAALINAQY